MPITSIISAMAICFLVEMSKNARRQQKINAFFL